MNTMFEHKMVHKCTWYQTTLGQMLMIDFVFVSLDLCPYILDTWLKSVQAGGELDHWQGKMQDGIRT